MIALLLLAACARDALPSATISVGGHAVEVELATTREQRANGLMHREAMDEDHGMLFVYRDTKPRAFWMKNTPLPLSIAYANDQGQIMRIRDMTPHSTKTVKSLYPARYALEMNQGWFKRHDVAKGATLSGLPPLSPE